MDKIEVIFKDKNFIAVNKPAGLLVHPVKTNPNEQSLIDFLLKNFPEIKNVGDDPENRPGIVHRLDKDTSGIILIVRNQEYFYYLKKLFQTHQIKKTYIALVDGEMKEKKGIIDKPISLKSGSVKRTVWEGKMAKEAITEYKVLKHLSKNSHKFTLVEVNPKTGRTHQIRIHFSAIGHPIVGDNLYGVKKKTMEINRQFLHAYSLEFSSKDGQRVKIEADLSNDLEAILKTLTEG